MHIIFGKEQAADLADKYTVLELDTFQIGTNGPVVTAYCTLEAIPLGEMLNLAEAKTLHQQLITAYQQQNWKYGLELLALLEGKWNKALDSFYQDLKSRIQQNLDQNPGPDWSPIIVKD